MKIRQGWQHPRNTKKWTYGQSKLHSRFYGVKKKKKRLDMQKIIENHKNFSLFCSLTDGPSKQYTGSSLVQGIFKN